LSTLRHLFLIFLAVLLGFLFVWVYLSSFASVRVNREFGTPGVGTSIIEIVSAASKGSTVSVKLDLPGSGPAIVAVYVTALNGPPYGGALTPRVEFSPPTNGTVVSVDVQKAEGGAGKILESGDMVKVVTADGGQAAGCVYNKPP